MDDERRRHRVPVRAWNPVAILLPVLFVLLMAIATGLVMLAMGEWS